MRTLVQSVKNSFGLAISFFIIALAAGTVSAGTYVVTNTSDNDPGSLRAAIAAANGAAGADTIEFDPTVFATPKTIFLTSGQLTISSELTINGPGADLLNIDANSNSRVLFVSQSTVVINGLSITDGNASNEVDFDDRGSGVVNAGTLTINNCKIFGNIVPGFGLGGGIYNAPDGAMAVNNSTINNNQAFNGGGIFNRGLLNVTGSSIAGNVAQAGGGGISTSDSDYDTFINNSTISGNTASFGGGIYADFVAVSVRNSTISGNEVSGSGGGVFVSSLTGFQAFSTTIVGNRANSDDNDENFDEGGGMKTFSNPGSTVVNNCIIAGNIQGFSSPVPSDISAPTQNLGAVSNNNVVGSSGEYDGGMSNGNLNNIVGVNPGDVVDLALADNGGPTLTHKLVAGSVAINSGANFMANDDNGDPLLYDQRGPGFPRVVGLILDRGSYEAEQIQAATSTVLATPATTQYSDVVQLSSTTTVNGSPVTSGTVEFFVNGSSVGSDTVDSNGVATLSTQILLPAGSYPVSATYAANASYESSTGSSLLTVAKEDATVTASTGNPESVKVSSPGGNAGPITLCAAITDAADGSLGDIALAVPVTFVLSPVAPGSTLQASDAVLSSGTACVTFNSVPVNVYDVSITVGGNYYTGAGSTVLAVYDPSLGFTTGGGRVVNPNTGNTLQFGFSFKYDKKSFKGQMLVMEHTANGVVKLKSNSLSSLSIIGSQAIVLGKASIMDGSGNLSFRLNVIDNGEPGTSDRFGLKLTMANGTVVPAFTIDPPTLIAGGNIQVPQGAR